MKKFDVYFWEEGEEMGFEIIEEDFSPSEPNLEKINIVVRAKTAEEAGEIVLEALRKSITIPGK